MVLHLENGQRTKCGMLITARTPLVLYSGNVSCRRCRQCIERERRGRKPNKVSARRRRKVKLVAAALRREAQLYAIYIGDDADVERFACAAVDALAKRVTI